MEQNLPCRLCGEPALVTVAGFSELPRVTSDCKPWPAGGRLARCTACGGVQKLDDAEWRRETERIYADYTIYFQAGGAEQSVFEATSGAASSRSSQIIGRLWEARLIGDRGHLLDVGCGNGAFLRAAAAGLPEWTLAGTELSDKVRAAVLAIPGVAAFYAGEVDQVPGRFDLISLLHVLEHVPDPAGFLRVLGEKLTDAGALFIEVPEFQRNPFDLLIADHCTHFSPASLRGLLRRSGFRPDVLTNEWISKEISCLARCHVSVEQSDSADGDGEAADLDSAVDWLRDVRALVHHLAGRGRLGIFGTSIAAAWLAGDLGEAVQFYVDEDPARIGRTFFGRAVLALADVPAGSDVFLALPHPIAIAVQARLAPRAYTLHVPPDLSRR